MIALLDYGSGNLRSVEKALRKVNADVRLAKGPADLRDTRAAVLPGVGAFDDCLNALQRQELLAALKEFMATGRPMVRSWQRRTDPIPPWASSFSSSYARARF